MIEWLHDFSATTVVVLISFVFVSFTWGGIIFIRPFLRVFVKRQTNFNAALSSFISVYGLFYGILIGLLAVAAFQNKNSVETKINEEGTSIVALYRLSAVLPEQESRRFQNLMHDYCKFVVYDQWPRLRQGILFDKEKKGMKINNEMQRLILNFEPQTPGQEINKAELVNQYFKFLDHQSERVYSANVAIPGIMWFVVLFGALLNIMLMWLYEMKIVVHFLLSGFIAFFIGTMISLLIVLDQPLRGASGIPPQVHETLLLFIERLDTPSTSEGA